MMSIGPIRHERRALFTLVAAAVLLGPVAARAQESFKTPEDASEAFGRAVKSDDRGAMLTVLGQGGADIISSGDPVADAAMRERFIAAYDDGHKIAKDGDKKATMIIGEDEFPFPIPLVRKNGAWQFDTAEGRREIVYRRIGRNEIAAMRAVLAYADAQNEYADEDRTGDGTGVYAQRIVSEPGKKNGLYWPASQGGGESPLGELMAQATRQGYNIGGGRAPYHGYYFKVLTKQGANAPGGALNYVVNGKMIGGFGLVAYPAQYGNSGVMTFLVNHSGAIYEKDLGPRTTEMAEQMTSYNPDQTWKKVPTPEPAN